MSQISLTAPMRSTLLALQNIARGQDIVQNRLATGLKVSSAIDNPSAYYTAASLSNRAADLSALLDAMSQGVQTIKSASEAIDAGIKFLEQAKAVANQALETAVPAKEWFIEQVGENGAVVETAQELLDAVNTGKETIVVYGKINMENQNIVLKQGQRLVGTEYFTGTPLRNRDGSRFSQLSFVTDQADIEGIRAYDNCLVSDLDISHRHSKTISESAVQAYGDNVILANLNIDFQGSNLNTAGQSAISVSGSGHHLTLSGNINITATAGAVRGIGVFTGSSLLIDQGANISVTAERGTGLWLWARGNAVIKGNLSISQADTGIGLAAHTNVADYAGNSLTVTSGAKLNFKNCTAAFSIQRVIDNSNANKMQLEQGCRISINKNYFFCNGYEEVNDSGVNHIIDLNNILSDLRFSPATPFSEYEEETFTVSTAPLLYSNILAQYDRLIKDASYKGINLLDGQKLKINFNEDRSAQIDVMGVKADSDSLGLKTKEWENAGDIEDSISELENAINSLRSFASAFGNYYSIVTTRQDFTENLINVLEEGADKLTLADMNEESANMLALQTSQQLAINSLSLASQAAQSVLKLF